MVVGRERHKRSVTVEVMTGDHDVVGGGRFHSTVQGHPARERGGVMLGTWSWSDAGGQRALRLREGPVQVAERCGIAPSTARQILQQCGSTGWRTSTGPPASR